VAITNGSRGPMDNLEHSPNGMWEKFSEQARIGNKHSEKILTR